MKNIIILILSVIGFSINGVWSQSGWNSLNTGTSQRIGDIFFIDSNTGFAGCAGGILIKTTNSGVNWVNIPVPIGSNDYVNYVRFFNANTGLIFGNSAGYRTTNSGLNWNIMLSTFISSVSNIFNDSTVFAAWNYLYKSTNLGLNWINITAPFNTPARLFFINNNTGWAVNVETVYPPPTYNSVLLKTTNSGLNWMTQFMENYPTGLGINSDVFFPTTDTGYFASPQTYSSTYRLNHSYNGGTTWIPAEVDKNIKRLFFINAKTGWGTIFGDKIYKTTNAGMNWYETFSGNQYMSILSIIFVNQYTGFAGGNSGLILKTTTGGEPTSINNISSDVPEKFSLSQNYPNPFNPTTKIRFSLPNPSKGGAQNVQITVYDILGRKVASLIPAGQEEFQPGTYEVDWDGSNFSNGVYYYTIYSGNYIETKKMILLK